MALTTVSAQIGGATKSLIAAADGSANLAAAQVNVNSSGTEVGIATAPIFVAGGSLLATNQVSVGATATLICAARVGRQSITIIQEGATLVRIGASGVTVSTGVPLPAVQYEQLTIPGGAAVYGIVASGTQLVSYFESY